MKFNPENLMYVKNVLSRSASPSAADFQPGPASTATQGTPEQPKAASDVTAAKGQSSDQAPPHSPLEAGLKTAAGTSVGS
jgi:hypothetical protein